MEWSELNYAVEDGVGLITLNRPDRLNAWTPTLEVEFRSVIETAQQDDAVRCVVLTGAGRAKTAQRLRARKRLAEFQAASRCVQLGQLYYLEKR